MRDVEAREDRPLGIAGKAVLVVRVWYAFVVVVVGLRRSPLPEFVQHLSRTKRTSSLVVRPRKLGRIVYHVLGVGRLRPRCLISALVLYRLLRGQGTDAVVVIGLPEHPKDKDAHAWIEVDGTDVGPPPGRGRHEPLARYP
jgi:Transglutaminase-like superfamily